MHISVFFSDGMYSVLTILCNYLQIINQITLFIKKKYFKILAAEMGRARGMGRAGDTGYCPENFDINKF